MTKPWWTSPEKNDERGRLSTSWMKRINRLAGTGLLVLLVSPFYRSSAFLGMLVLVCWPKACSGAQSAARVGHEQRRLLVQLVLDAQFLQARPDFRSARTTVLPTGCSRLVRVSTQSAGGFVGVRTTNACRAASDRTLGRAAR